MLIIIFITYPFIIRKSTFILVETNIIMKKKLLIRLIALLAVFTYVTKADAQQWAVGTNGLYWLTGTPNVGIEYGFH